MAAVHCGTFDVKHFQTKDVQVSLRTIRQTMPGICSQISKTKHRSGISQLLIFWFSQVSVSRIPWPQDMPRFFWPSDLSGRNFHAFCLHVCLLCEWVIVSAIWFQITWSQAVAGMLAAPAVDENLTAPREVGPVHSCLDMPRLGCTSCRFFQHILIMLPKILLQDLPTSV